MIGRVLADRYELGEVVGQGGMAVVYRALDRTLGRHVAVKVLREQFAADPEFVERFDREARSAARLSHPNIVDIYDVGEDKGTRFIVMELVDGANLKTLIRTKGALPPALVLTFGREIGSALDYAHRRGLVHRDVKPQNVLVDAEGHAKLTDFGIAQAAEHTSLTQTGVLGTPHYMAPEQARGSGAGPASDIYSLGVVLYELATGRLPFVGDTPLSIALRHIEEAPTPPRRLNPSIPPGLEAIIIRAMAKDPANRYATAGQLVDALASGADPMRERTTRAAPVPLPAGGQRRAGSAAGDSGRATLAPTVVRRSASGRAVPAAADRPAARGGSALILLLLVLVSLAALGLGFYWLFGTTRPSPSSQPTPTLAPALVGSPTPAPLTATRPPATANVAPSPTVDSTTTPTPAPTATATATPQPTAQSTPTPRTPTPAPTAAPTQPPSRVNVPRLVGLNLGQAQQQLTALNLVMEFTPGSDPRAPQGVILEQEPKEGAPVPQRSVVRVVVNRLTPAMLVSVPNVQGKEASEARRTLEQAGFKVSVDEIRRGQKGVVNDQSPEPGSRVPPGSEVRITVGS